MKLTNVLQNETEFIALCKANSLTINIQSRGEDNVDKLRKILDLVVLNNELIDGFDYTDEEKAEIKELIIKCQDDNDTYNMVFEKLASSHEQLESKPETDDNISNT